jgi:hypothetical protein
VLVEAWGAGCVCVGVETERGVGGGGREIGRLTLSDDRGCLEEIVGLVLVVPLPVPDAA